MRARRSRGGRPRKESTGPDLGTPEQQARRLALVGGADSGVDPAYSESPLGRLFALGLITREEMRSAAVYAWLYRRATGWTPVGAARIYDGITVPAIRSMAIGSLRDGPETERATAQRRFRAVKNRLLSAGRSVCDATENLVVFEMNPGFLSRRGDRSAMRSLVQRSAHFRAIRAGLAILSASFGAGATRAGDMATHRYASLSEDRRRSRR
jgi:hypothetical protein